MLSGMDPLGRLVADAGGMEAQYGHMLRLHRRRIVLDIQGERREGTQADPTLQAHPLPEVVQACQGG
jgi:hypothetical protein